MHPHEELITKFYESFQATNSDGMKACYHEDVVFNDEVFKKLDFDHVASMWSMLLRGAKKDGGLELVFDSVEANDDSGSANWTATYKFQGRKVVNRIHAEFTFKDGKIVTHNDSFDFYKWAKQALPLGFVLGLFIRPVIQKFSMKTLKGYMAKHKV
mmetsp:Transcript_6661/g.8068  ORF Transcript_6661/g.8068 Transcript_6661/m.8068 type:complete len:156 (-) Transcript_6661:930-1397(-)